ncbi:MAG TPA: hypothetical protein VFS44_10740 [Gemmatimonadaceae bacterium]|nr:hypothetical protein [Gemmatimonadaceae bacterium]
MHAEARGGWLAVSMGGVALAAGLALGAGRSPSAGIATAAPAPAPAPPWQGTAPSGTTHVYMRDVGFHLDDQLVLDIAYLKGTMRPLRPGSPIFFDDKKSFAIHLDDAVVSLTAENMTLLLNRYVFGYPGAPLRHLSVTTTGNRIVQKGILHKVVDIPFEITADLSVTPDGHLRIHPVATRIFDVDGAGLMRALHLTLEKLLDLSKAKGVSVKGNDLFLSPDSIVPPPTIEGHVTGVRVAGNRIVQIFGDSSAARAAPTGALTPPNGAAAHYMYYRGGTLRFGKLVMLDADLQIIDADSSDTFDFDIDHYLVQLVAGYSRTTPEGGLEVLMPDYDDATKMLSSRRPLAPPALGGRP